jgi:NitT/TauT family transport system substrate-binding protein
VDIHVRMTKRTVWLCVAVAGLAGCKKTESSRAGEPLRLAFLQNITHSQALVGQRTGAFAKALAPTALEVKQFNAGPAAMEALLAGELDVAYVGPGPATTAFVRSKGALRIIAGAASGGAVFVVKGVEKPEDLKGRRVGVPQLGNTQDIALRHWLGQNGLAIGQGADQVQVTPLPNPEIMNLFKQGELIAAWVPEPWGARLVAEAGARIFVDERELWPQGRFPTTVLVATTKALKDRRAEVEKVLRVHVQLTEQARNEPEAFLKSLNEAFGAVTGKPMPEPVLKDAFSRIEFLTDPLEDPIHEGAKHAQQLGYLPTADVTGLVDRSLLDQGTGAAGVGGSGPR